MGNHLHKKIIIINMELKIKSRSRNRKELIAHHIKEKIKILFPKIIIFLRQTTKMQANLIEIYHQTTKIMPNPLKENKLQANNKQ